MKHISIIAILLFVITSCNTVATDKFKGFGELQIGKNIDSLSILEKFEKKDSNQFYCKKMEISKEIGYVEDVEIKTDNRKIYYVAFKSGKFTSRPAIDSKMSGMIKKPDLMDESQVEVISYEGKYDITANRITITDKNIVAAQGHYISDYSYYDNSTFLEISRKEYDDKLKKEKEEYLKN